MNKEKTYLYLEAENPGSGARHLASDEDLSVDDITVADTGQRGSLRRVVWWDRKQREARPGFLF